MQAYKYQVFTSVIEEQIKNGTLALGDRLPSVRTVKEKYHLSTSSVQSGYDDLVMKGWAESRPRSGFFVSAEMDRIDEKPSDFFPVERNTEFTDKIDLTSKADKKSEYHSFNVATPSDLLIPQKLILRKMQEVIREKGSSILRYYPETGLEILRNKIADRRAMHGSQMNADEMIITDGALQALYIALSSVTKAGDCIAVESPSAFSVLEVLMNLQLKVIEIPVHDHKGFDLDYLKNVLLKNELRAIVVTPNFHNPTGIVMSDEAKKELLAVAENHEIPVIENDMYGDLYFGHERPSSISDFDKNGWVMTYSSFSKTLAPGIRLGWLSAGRFFAKAERMKFSLGRSVSPFYQELMVKLLEGTTYDRHLRFFRKQLEKQSVEVLNVLRKSFHPDAYFHRPGGGYSIWGKLPEGLNTDDFYQCCEKNKIAFTPGNTFSLTRQYHRHFRIIFADRITSENISALKTVGEMTGR